MADVPLPEPAITMKHGPWKPSQFDDDETYCAHCLTRSIFAHSRRCDPRIDPESLRAYIAAVTAVKDAEIAQLRADAIDRQNNVVVSLRKRVMTLEIELGEYANPLNWEEDEQGVRRMWREPWTRTPTAYDGFESARKALES